MISVSRFTLFRKGTELIVTGLEDIPCPNCGGNLCVHGTCKRKLKVLSGETYTLRLRVMECSMCRKTHRELSLLAKASTHHGLNAARFENLHSLVAQLFAGKHFAGFQHSDCSGVQIQGQGLTILYMPADALADHG